MKIVRMKSIPNVETERLLADAGRIHEMIHTPEGIYAHEDTRRAMINFGVKSIAIHNELAKRGEDFVCCHIIERIRN